MSRSAKSDVEDRALFQRPLEDDRATPEGIPAIERMNNTLRAYHEIRRRILSGEMKAGTQFLEQELAELLRMSRTPVREATIRLAEERLVEVRPRHGVRILPLTAADVREAYELLTELQVFAVRLIAERGLRNEDYNAMADALVAMEAALKRNDAQQWASAEREFHFCLVAAVGNSRLADFCRVLADQTHHARMKYLAKHSPTSAITRGHADVLDALRRQSPDEAQKLTRQQLAVTGRILYETMKKEEGTAKPHPP